MEFNMKLKFEFSKLSKVQDILKKELMAKYDEKLKLIDDDLDMVAAAGTIASPELLKQKKLIFPHE